jgi:hypothetical protein
VLPLGGGVWTAAAGGGDALSARAVRASVDGASGTPGAAAALPGGARPLPRHLRGPRQGRRRPQGPQGPAQAARQKQGDHAHFFWLEMGHFLRI